MKQVLPRTLMVSAASLCLAAFVLGACTHTTDRVIEPVGVSDAGTADPDTSDASVAPIGPVARSHHGPEADPPPDFTLVRSPEFGSSVRSESHMADGFAVRTIDAAPSMGGVAGMGGSGAGGGGGSEGRPVSSGGSSYF